MKTKLYTILSLAVFTAALLSCKNITTFGTTRKSTANVSGKVELNGAVPKEILGYEAASSLRTATTSFERRNSSLEWEVRAIPCDENGQILDSTRWIYGNLDENMNFSYQLTEGEWDLEIQIWSYYDDMPGHSATILSSRKKVTVDEWLNDINNIDITITPCYDTHICGKLNLSFTDDAKEMDFSTVTLKDWEDVTYSRGDDYKIQNPAYMTKEDVSSPVPSLTAAFTGKTATVTCDKVISGAYKVHIIFANDDGTNVFETYELINIFAGLVTDTWQGKSSYFTADPETGNKIFTVNDGTINMEPSTTPDTDILLYEKNSTDTYSFYLSDGNEYEKENLTENTDLSANTDMFCFDGEGNVYTLTLEESGDNESGTIKYTLHSNKDNWENSILFNKTNGKPDGRYRQITIDRETGDLYAIFTPGAGGNRFDLHIFPGLANKSKWDSTDQMLTLKVSFKDSWYNTPMIAVNGGVIYALVIRYQENGSIYKYSECNLASFTLPNFDAGVTTKSYEIDTQKLITMNFSNQLGLYDSEVNESVKITDMLYQDENLYFLISYEQPKMQNNTSICFKGGVIQMSAFGGRVTIIDDWTDNINVLSEEKITVEEEELEVCSCYVYQRHALENILYAATEESEGTLKGINPLFTKIIFGANAIGLSPEDAPKKEVLINKSLVSPQKFIAIKPKKLVIADDGFAFYTNKDGAFGYKNRNAVVTVDLENFAVKKQEETNCTFTNTKTDIIAISCSYDYLEQSNVIYSSTDGNVYEGDSYYLNDGNQPSQINTNLRKDGDGDLYAFYNIEGIAD